VNLFLTGGAVRDMLGGSSGTLTSLSRAAERAGATPRRPTKVGHDLIFPAAVEIGMAGATVFKAGKCSHVSNRRL
jgi:hypothetical protein